MQKQYKTDHTIDIVKPNVIINQEATPIRIKLRTDKKPNIGSKLNKRCVNVKIDKKERMKIYKTAKKRGYFSLNTFCDFYRFYTNMSRHLIYNKISTDEVVFSYFKAKGYIEAKMSNNGTYVKWFVKFEHRTQFAREVKAILTSNYQEKTEEKRIALKKKYSKR